MPIYEYACPDCQTEFELMQRIGAEPPPCTKCGGTRVSKMMSRTSFVLKGGGWYKDGYTGASNQKGDAKPAAEGGGDAPAVTADKPATPAAPAAPAAPSAPAAAPSAPSTSSAS